ncbi:MAG: hypothetical protein Q9200_003076 [Gallowayella weberi]
MSSHTRPIAAKSNPPMQTVIGDSSSGSGNTCDGQSPQSCSRCQTRGLDCRYEPHSKTRKEYLLQEIANLKRDNSRLKSANREVSDAAADLQEKHQGLQDLHEWQQIILDTIGRNGHDRDIITKLRGGESSEDIARWLCRQKPISSHLHIVPAHERGLVDIVDAFEHHYRREDGLGRDKRSDTLRLRWTEVTASQTLLGHLFDLYFTWVHPIHMLFSEVDFKNSFRENSDTYCSSALVNAICAMACHLVDASDLDDDVDIDALAAAFMNQARVEVLPQNYTRLTSVQALAVMYLADLSSCKARSATGYLRVSVEFLKAAELDGQSLAAREISTWGIQTLNTGTALYGAFTEPLEISEISPLNLYCGIRGVATAEMILIIYRRYLDWESDLPPILKAVNTDSQPLPHILFLHVQYHVAVVQHLTPLLQSGCFEGSNFQELRRLVVQNAQSGVETLEQYRQLYSTRYLMPLLSFCIVHLGDALIRYSPRDPPASDIVEFVLGLLQQASAGFPICGPLQELFRRTAVECGIKMPPNVEVMTGTQGSYGVDDILDACTRLDYKQPVDQSIRHIDENVAAEWPNKWQEIVNSPDRPPVQPSTRRFSRSPSSPGSAGSDQHMRIEALLNT